MKKLYYSFCFLLVMNHLLAEEYLRIGDVQDSWSTYDGSIDKATILVTPKGVYAECQVFLDFSVQCTPFTDPYDSLEIQMGFRLPVEAEVTDLWLWVNGVPVQADVYDRWTASQIYESFVDRRTDPALLVKQSDTDYELHIFPLMVNLPRKIKLTFLVPFNKLTGSDAQVTLPLNILKLSDCPINSITVAYKKDQYLANPKLLEAPLQNFVYTNDPSLGACYVTDLGSISQLNSLTLSLASLNQADYFAGYYPESSPNEGEYQFELDLAEIFQIPDNKKTLFLIDFIKNNTSLSRAHVLLTLKNYISTWYSEGDSINFMFSGISTNIFSNTWLSADPASLSQVFSILDTTFISNTSNLPDLLLDGINFIQSFNHEGQMVLIASSSLYTYVDDANELYEEVVNFMGPDKIPIHIINLDDYSYMTYLSNDVFYRGNEYFYSTLSAYTGGEFQTILDYWYNEDTWWYEPVYYSYEAMLGSLFPKLSGYFTALDVYASLQSGFTYANYNLSSIDGFTYFGSPFRQVGKYYGSFPMNISISALTAAGDLYNTVITIDAPYLLTLDSVTKTIWAGQSLREMLTFTQTNSVVFEIIETSKIERVLCKYTAMLALEPGMAIPDTVFLPVVGVIWEGTEIHNPEPHVLENLNCYPNPVTTVAYFEFNTDEVSDVVIELFSMEGEKVSNVVSQKYLPGHHSATLNAAGLKAGIYIYRVRINNELASTGKIVVVN